MSEYLSSLLAEPERFEITDDGKAEWAIQKIKEANYDTVKWQEHFAQQLAKIKAENDSTAAYMTGLLADYFATVPHKEAKTQSTYKLPSATLIRKQQQPDYQKDDPALVSWLESSGMEEFIDRKPVPKWGELKKRCIVQGDGSVVDAESGEIVQGVVAVARPDKFEVKINGTDS